MKLNNEQPVEATYVDENRRVTRGKDALELIKARKHDNVDPEKGVTKVDDKRWQEAQRYERRTWMEGIAAISDRNEDHEQRFDQYDALRGIHFGSAIELGCGPFTNLRKILSYSTIDDIHLLDPLSGDYLNHPFCRYKDRRLGGILKTSLIPWTKKGGLKHPLRFYKHKWDELKIGGLSGRPITLHQTGIEDFSPPQTYDLCVMINVIEHCKDIDQIFANILKMTRPGSYFVFADKAYYAKEEEEYSSHNFDAGHPLRVDYSIIRDFIKENFEPIHDKEYNEQEPYRKYTTNYFIGIRR